MGLIATQFRANSSLVFIQQMPYPSAHVPMLSQSN